MCIKRIPEFISVSKKATAPIGRLSLIRLAWWLWSKSGGRITCGGTVLNQDFKEFIQSLNDNQVRYLVIGGYAVALHGHPRQVNPSTMMLDNSS